MNYQPIQESSKIMSHSGGHKWSNLDSVGSLPMRNQQLRFHCDFQPNSKTIPLHWVSSWREKWKSLSWNDNRRNVPYWRTFLTGPVMSSGDRSNNRKDFVTIVPTRIVHHKSLKPFNFFPLNGSCLPESNCGKEPKLLTRRQSVDTNVTFVPFGTFWPSSHQLGPSCTCMKVATVSCVTWTHWQVKSCSNDHFERGDRIKVM